MEESTTLPIAGPTPASRNAWPTSSRDGARRLLAGPSGRVALWIESHAHLQGRPGRRARSSATATPSGPSRWPRRTSTSSSPGSTIARPGDRRGTSSAIFCLPYLRRTQEPGGVGCPLAVPSRASRHRRLPGASGRVLGPDARGVSRPPPSTPAQGHLGGEYEGWSKRSLGGQALRLRLGRRRPFQHRLERDRQCILVLMGATTAGKKELIGVTDGYRESEQSWKGYLVPGRCGDPGNPRWRSAATRRWGSGRRSARSGPRHEVNAVGPQDLERAGSDAQGVQPKAKAALHEIYEAETKAAAEKAFDLFVAT